MGVHIYIFNTHDGSGAFRCVIANKIIGCENMYGMMLSDYKRAM